jgi:hypothetical protein
MNFLPSPRERRVSISRQFGFLFLAMAVSTFGLLTARGEIEFIGILATSQSTRFALTNTVSGKTDWVQPGDLFSGYKVVSHDREKDTLLLRDSAGELRIRLKDDAKIKSARLELTGSITFGAQEKIEVERATLLYDQENVFPLKEGLVYRITPRRLPDGNIRYTVAMERTLSETKKESVAAPNITTRPGQPFTLRIDDLNFTFTPR